MDSQQPAVKRKVSKRGRVGEGRPSKATPERLCRILADMSRGLTREQACAANDVCVTKFEIWEKRPEFRWLRAKAQAARIYAIQNDMHVAGLRDWKYYRYLAQFFYQRCFSRKFSSR
jgi:hypothetical protein